MCDGPCVEDARSERPHSFPSGAPHSGHGTLSASLRTKARAPPLERSPTLLMCLHRRGACLSFASSAEPKWVNAGHPVAASTSRADGRARATHRECPFPIQDASTCSRPTNGDSSPSSELDNGDHAEPARPSDRHFLTYSPRGGPSKRTVKWSCSALSQASPG